MPAQSNGPLSVSPPETFFAAMCSSFAIARDVDLRARIGVDVVLVAEASRPVQQRTNRLRRCA